MTGLNVLSSTGLKGVTGSDSGPSPKTRTGSSDDSVSAEFTAILGGWMFPVDGSKGQDSGEKKSGDEKQQSPQDSLGTMTVSNELGLQKVLAGLLELSQAELILQNDFPAGKEANSGGAVNQGNNIPIDLTNLSVGNKPLESAMTLQWTGMIPQMSMGDSSPILSELDEYKSIISRLLKELSGEVRVVSLSSNEDGLKANGSKSTLDWLRTNMSTVMDQLGLAGEGFGHKAVVNSAETLSEIDEQSSNITSKQLIGANKTPIQGTIVINGLNTEVNGTALENLVLPLQNAKLVLDDQNQTAEQLKVEKEVLTNIQGKPVTLMQNRNHQDQITSINGVLNTSTNSTELNNISQIVEVNNRNQFAKGVQNKELSQNTTDLTKSVSPIITVEQQSLAINADLSKGSFAGNNKEKGSSHSKISSDETVIDDGQVVNSKFNLSNLSSLMAKENTQKTFNTDNKGVTLPVWEQISASVQRHLVSQHPEIKELEIQLHPADLGKIQLSIRWENGQVHLQCQATESATTSMLQQNLAQLRESLQNSGISCGMLQMGLGGQHQQKPKSEFNAYIQSNEKEVEEKNGQLRGISYSANGHLTDHLINVMA